jgi:hypothetical protein
MLQINEELKINLPKEVETQKQRIQNGNPPLELIGPCRVEEGILKFSDSELNHLTERALSSKKAVGFFIPASGSGSRMFQFLYSYLSSPTEENSAKVERFFNSMDKMAFYTILPIEMQDKLQRGDYNIQEVAEFILGEKGFGLGILPKGLIPFHKIDQFVLNPFQDQILQGERVLSHVAKFHFTIQKEFEDKVRESIENLRKFTGPGKRIDFSEQNPESDAYAFCEDNEVVQIDGNGPLRRPSGHGALLENLNSVQEEIILIKNIDNIQHFDFADNATKTWQVLIGLLVEVKEKMDELISNFSKQAFLDFNLKYQLYHVQEAESWSDDKIKSLLSRPLRACGMVRNMGQAGGGPYWVKDAESTSKQIVEKAQIAHTDAQQSLMVKSTHFNPVMMALSTRDSVGNKFNLRDFMDEEKYFIVEKEYQGKKIRYCELPGLWNGSMANWNTLFVDIPNKVFSPVKTMLDLLQPAHQSKNINE